MFRIEPALPTGFYKRFGTVASTLVADPGTGQLGRTGRRLQKQERLKGGKGE